MNRIKLHEKRAHYIQLFQKIGKNSKFLWNVVNNLVKKSNNKHEVTSLLYDNQLCTSESDICQAFNAHFSNAGKRVQESINTDVNGNACDFVKNCQKSMSFKRVTEAQICNIVKNLKSKTSSSIDHVSNVLLKKIIHCIKAPLCQIFNKSLNSGIFPDLMKLAKVIPLYKNGSHETPDNYRPISLLPVIFKSIREACVQFNSGTSGFQQYPVSQAVWIQKKTLTRGRSP